jgi:hypothetical protein
MGKTALAYARKLALVVGFVPVDDMARCRAVPSARGRQLLCQARGRHVQVLVLDRGGGRLAGERIFVERRGYVDDLEGVRLRWRAGGGRGPSGDLQGHGHDSREEDKAGPVVTRQNIGMRF